MRTIYFIFGFLLLVSCNNQVVEEAKQLNDEGVSRMDEEEYTQASLLFNRALKTGDLPKELSAGIFRNLSLLYTFQNEKDSALYYAKIGFEGAEKDSYFYFLNKAEYLLLTNNVSDAISNYEKAKKLKSDEMAIYNSLGMIYSGSYGEEFKNYDKAMENNLKAYEITQREPLQEALAISYMNLERYKESIPFWKILIEKNPSKMEYHFQLGVAYFFSGKEGEGEKKMEYAADRDENCRRMLDEMMVE